MNHPNPISWYDCNIMHCIEIASGPSLIPYATEYIISVGDQVRISKVKKTFEKGYTPNWSVEIFTVSERLPRKPPVYRLKDQQGEPLEGILLGFGNGTLYSKTTTAEREVDLDHGFHNLYVYCDIVESQCVGNAQVPLLRIVPVEGEDGQRVSKTFMSPQYLPVSRKEFESIEVNIRRDSEMTAVLDKRRICTGLSSIQKTTSQRCIEPLPYLKRTKIIIVFFGEIPGPSEPVKDYRMTRVTFGIASSAFLATNTLKYLSDQHQSDFPLANKAVKESFYVGDGLFSVPTKEEAITLQRELQELFSKGEFKLHKWNSNSPEVLECIPPDICSQGSAARVGESEVFVKTLGLEYDAGQDHFKFSAPDSVPDTALTKRMMLSTSNICGNSRYNETILYRPPEIERYWLTWSRKGLSQISSLRIPRCYAPLHANIVSTQLIGFCGASERAYCGIVYLRSVDTAGGVHLSIVIAKTKFAPLKKVSFPRLELCGAQLLAQLLKYSQDVTDSTIVLYWISKGSQCFKTFEANRIAEIQQLVPPESWGYNQDSVLPYTMKFYLAFIVLVGLSVLVMSKSTSKHENQEEREPENDEINQRVESKVEKGLERRSLLINMRIKF
ncbi:hypothetical protein QZH41_000397 [Actinostola sp. cb2023]|nr:hypothetical protein QZH41_000397 [Actinostola sp. cb2023]